MVMYVLTWKCLLKLNHNELKDVLLDIDSYSFENEGWEEVYPSKIEVLEYIHSQLQNKE